MVFRRREDGLTLVSVARPAIAMPGNVQPGDPHVDSRSALFAQGVNVLRTMSMRTGAASRAFDSSPRST